MSAKRNHHLQPNFYLKGFKSSDEGNPKIWVYEKGKPFYDGKTEQLQNPRHLTTEKAARKKDFYAFVKEDGSKEYEKYEDLLMKEFEQPADSVIEKIRSLEELDENEKEVMSRYIASMIFRGDWWRNLRRGLQDFYSSPEYCQERSKEKGVVLDRMKAIEISKAVKRKIGYDNKYETLENMIEKTNLISAYLKKMKWRFLVVQNALYFFTGDNPVWYRNLKDFNTGEVIFPISSKVALSVSWLGYESNKWKRKSKCFWEVDDNTIKNARECIASFAVKEIYSPIKANWLVKFINNRIDK